MRLVLASASPRRRELLERLGVDFDVVAAEVDEAPLLGERPRAYVRRVAAAKAAAISADGDVVVLAADTTVDVDGRILAKPVDDDDARAMLRSMSGRTHRVHTGVAMCRGEGPAREAVTDVVTTYVTMVPMTPALVEWYVATGEPHDKAGAYAIQGAGAVLVERVRGSVSNVVG